jgi:hypothetical protein
VRKGLDGGQASQRRAVDPLVPRRVYEALHRAHRVQHGTRWSLLVGGLAAAAAAVVIAGQLFGGDGPLSYVLETEAGAPARASTAEAAGGTPVLEAGVLRFSEGSAVTFRPGSRGRLSSVTARGAQIDIADGRARARVGVAEGSPHRATFTFDAGPYQVVASAAELEIGWVARRQLLMVSLFTGQAQVRGAAGHKDPVALGAGETLIARASDGVLRVGRGRALLDGLVGEGVERVTDALGAVADQAAGEPPASAGDEASSAPPRTAGTLALDERGGLDATGALGAASDDAGGCRLYETSAAAAAMPDPGPVSLHTCRHVDPGPSGKDVAEQPDGELWVRAGPGGCLRYLEDARGNRVPDFSHAGYRGGGVPLPLVSAPAGATPLLPGGTGDDTPAIQAAIDAVSALPADASGRRGVVELAAGTFALKGTLRIEAGGVVLRGQGSEGPSATVLRGTGNPRPLLHLGPKGKRRMGLPHHAVSDVYVPVGARSFTLDNVGDLKVGDDIVVYRPKTQRWICAIGTDVLPSRRDGVATPPWKASGALTYERRIVRIEGKRVVVDAPLTNALEREYTQAYITRLEFPERVSEVGVEHLAARWDPPAGGRCPSGKEDFIRVNSVANAWIKNVRSEGLGGEVVTLGSQSKWVTIEDASFQGVDDERCDDQWAFKIGGQQNLLVRGRASGNRFTALFTETEVEGPNAVVDFLAVGAQPRVRVASRWSTGLLFDNVRIQDAAGQPAGDFDLARGRSSHGWSAVNSVLWNSEAEVFSVDNPPTARNWIMGGGAGAKALLGTGTYSVKGAAVQPQSLYRAQLSERLGRPLSAGLNR